jgi:hypothetical protein
VTIDLAARSLVFAQETQDLLEQILPNGDGEDVELRKLKVLAHDDSFVIRPGDEKNARPVWLLKDGEHVADLDLSFKCALDGSRGYLAVRKSSFQLRSVRPKEGLPLLRLDFDHKMHSAPVAHWNVHGERGATSVLLSRCNPGHVGLLSQVHLPVGGVRYRPCLEDFLELLIVEFNFDVNTGWKAAVVAGREKWRMLQLRTAVRDSPADVAEVLRGLGYNVVAPDGGHGERNDGVFRCR